MRRRRRSRSRVDLGLALLSLLSKGEALTCEDIAAWCGCRKSYEWAIRFRERIAGGSVYWLNDVVDGGPIAAQDWCFVRPDDTAAELWRRDLAPMGLRLFSSAFDDLERGLVVARPQDTDLATWEPAVEGVPPLWRPDVPMLGSSRYQVVR